MGAADTPLRQELFLASTNATSLQEVLDEHHRDETEEEPAPSRQSVSRSAMGGSGIGGLALGINSSALSPAFGIQEMTKNIRLPPAIPSELLDQIGRTAQLSEKVTTDLQLDTLPTAKFLENYPHLPHLSENYLKQMQQVTRQSQQFAERLERITRPSSQLTDLMSNTIALQEEQLSAMMKAMGSPAQRMLEQVAFSDVASNLGVFSHSDQLDVLLRTYRPATDLPLLIQHDFPSAILDTVDFTAMSQAMNVVTSPAFVDMLQMSTKMNQFAIQAAVASPEFQQALSASFGVEFDVLSAAAQAIALQQAFDISTSAGAEVTVDWLAEALSDLLDAVLDQAFQIKDGRSGSAVWFLFQAFTSEAASVFGPSYVGVSTTAKQSFALGILITFVWLGIEKSYNRYTGETEDVKKET